MVYLFEKGDFRFLVERRFWYNNNRVNFEFWVKLWGINFLLYIFCVSCVKRNECLWIGEKGKMSLVFIIYFNINWLY